MEPPENDDPVWKLLGHASTARPGPMFAREVVRRVRSAGADRPQWSRPLRALLSRPAALGGGALAGAAALALLLGPAEPPAPESASPLAGGSAPADFDPVSEIGEVEYLGRLMAVTDPGDLDDEALADLVF